MKQINNILRLSYSPMTIFEFEKFRDDIDIGNYLENCTIYIIAKRKLPIMQLIEGDSSKVHLKISMQGISNELEIIISQTYNEKLFKGGLTYMRTGNNTKDEASFHSITLYRGDKEFILAANIDRLLHLHSQGLITLLTKGDPEPILTYDVLYVGQCTEQHIFKRFKSHHALQEILINENIIPENYQMVNDLVLLPFNISSDLVSRIDSDMSFEDVNDLLVGNHGINENAISLDCEKSLIKAINPKYNKTKFLNYPKSKDGLYKYNLNAVVYQIQEDIVLRYGEKCIYGDRSLKDASKIAVFENEEFLIY
ncbi:hypothetical protein [Paenibacillus xylanexedens]|uniref:hypothetical protein n=1 Tax=Paenibacillus xylanexedens TaxID=528191 RepID=UPI0011A64B73|nr:hypothetical protein [Paenibacillus xylanexedens]